MLLAFDGTLQGDYSDESSRAVYNQVCIMYHMYLLHNDALNILVKDCD